MSEYHVASFIVRCHGRYLDALVPDIVKIQGVEVHAQDSIGKIIVLAEGATHKVIANITDQIRNMANVIDVAAVYHEYMPADDHTRGHVQ